MQTLKRMLKNVYDAASALYAKEPERVNSAVLAAVVAVAAVAHVVINPLHAAGVVALILGILLKAEVTRQQVSSPKTVEKLVRQAKKS